jgi:uncharacterized membrane protein
MPWFALGYPVLAHLGVWLHNSDLQWLALLWLLAISLWDALRRARPWAWLVLAGGAALSYLLSLRGGSLYLLYIPPIAIPLAMLVLFGRSLLPGNIPLISRIAEIMRGAALPPILQTYTRHVTQLWCGVFIGLLISAIVTTFWATPAMWSLATNVLHYAAIGAVFVIEFAYRRMKYAHLESWGLGEYLKRVARTKIRF